MAKKAKLNVKNLICALIYILMGGLLIGAYFIPVLHNSLVEYDCAWIIENGGSDAFTAFAIMGLVCAILGALMILIALVSLFIKIKNIEMLMIVLTLLITILAVVILIIAITETGGLLNLTLAFGAFAFLIGGVVALLAALFQKSKL